MRRRKRDLWKAGIVVADVLLLLVLMTWVPLSAARADEGVSEAAMEGPVTVQAAPTEDATVTALSKEKLAQEVQQLKNQNEPDPLGWLQTNASFLFSTLVVVGGGLFGLWRWRVDRRDAQDKELKDRRNAQDKELKDRQNAQDKELEDRKTEREKRAEERFQAAVTGLGDEKEEAHIGAAILLRTFLRPGYEQFYTQTFDLAVANLRHHRTFKRMQPQLLDASQNTETPLPLTTLDHALIVVFKEAFPLARDQEKREPAFFNVTGISLDYAYLAAADLKELWGPKASLQEAELNEANLSEANLHGANLKGADLGGANLSGAILIKANLSEAHFSRANLYGAFLAEAHFSRANLSEADLRRAILKGAILKGADLSGADLSGAYLIGADLSGANLRRANLSGANLSEAHFRGVPFSGANLSGADLKGANLSEANLSGANLSGAKGLTKEQLAACQAKGAITDEAPTTSSAQPTAVPPPPTQSNDAQASSAPSAQGNLPPSETDGNSALSPQQEPEP